MRLEIRDEIPGRIRLATGQKRLTPNEADAFQAYLETIPQIKSVKLYLRSGNLAVSYSGDRAELLRRIAAYQPMQAADMPADQEKQLPAASEPQTSREINCYYKEKLTMRVTKRILWNTLVPTPVRTALTIVRAGRFVMAGLKALLGRKLEVAVLDATAIAVSILRKDYKTASSVMFLLGIGDLMEEWTHKKSVADLAGSMALNVNQVWLHTEGCADVLMPIAQVKEGDEIVVSVGNMIPLDGVVSSGEAMVNQASMTGESEGVRKTEGSSVYAGTVIEEGELIIRVKQSSGATRYEKIIEMIEASEKLKSSVESKASHLADRLVPYSFLGTGLAYLLTRNVQKALSVLMVDFSCALKLSMPVAVLSAMRECSEHKITVKGGKFLEAVAEADTIVFDKTGTLTKAQPTVREVVPFGGRSREEVLRIAACLEEHFPHSIANAVVQKAKEEHLRHEEMHAKVNYVIAHGIATEIAGEEALIGSYHFIFEDNHCKVPEGDAETFDALPNDCSLLYLAIGGMLAGVVCIEDPMREEAPEVIRALRALGIKKTVMMTGDSERTAREIAARAGVDCYEAEVLPEDKARFVAEEKALGHKVIMIGDGINDSPALSAADVGIAISEGSQLAREIADITISQDNLRGLVTLKQISNALTGRVNRNYRTVIGINSGILAMGLAGVFTPGVSAFVHNMSTVAIGMYNMTDLIEEP